MQKYFLFSYALVSYLMAMASVSLLILWVYPWSFMPMQIDEGRGGDFALLIDLALVALFGIQHSVMARPAFKQAFFAHRSASFRASTYTLFSALCLFAVFLFWQPIGGRVWSLSSGVGMWAMLLLYGAGWGVAFIATFQIDHFELFGLHQGYRALKGLPEPEPVFKKRGFYKYVRHPIQTGTLVGIWATPVMSSGHLLFSLGMTIYILIGLTLEERDLVRSLGAVYTRYKRQIPMLLPFKQES
jgi:methanethiol S-methyltransferase